MTNGAKDPDEAAFPDDGEARADAIEERIERLRRMKGWASETRVIAAVDVQAAEAPAPPAPTTRLTLTFSHGPDLGRTVEVDKDHFDVGSGEMARLRVLEPSLSARHCRISRDGDAFRVRDLNSQSGTFVNGSRIPLSSALAHGDTLGCGAVTFTVTIVDTASGRSSGSAPGSSGPSSGSAPGSSGAAAPAPAPEASSGLAAPVAEAPAPAAAPAAPAVESSAAPGPSSGSAPGSPARHTINEASMAGRAPPSGAPVDVPEVRPFPLAYLLYLDEQGGEGQALIPGDAFLSVGRKSAAGLRIADHGISGLHASFGWDGGQLVVRDLGSTNGTWMHGERVAEAALADDDVVRLGLLPLRVRIFDANADPSEVIEAAPVSPAAEPGASWLLVYGVRDAGGALASGRLGAMTLSGRDPCVVVGSGAVELPVPGLLPDHLQFDWSEQGLEVTAATRGAAFSLGGAPCRSATLRPGDRIEAADAVSLVAVAAANRAVPVEGDARRWAGHLRQVDASLELLFVDPRDTGGRVELALWGDGAMTVDIHAGDGGHERLGGELDGNLRQALVDSLICAGFPVVHRAAGAAGGPEVHAFRGDDRAAVRLTGELLATPQWQATYQLLRAISTLMAG